MDEEDKKETEETEQEDSDSDADKGSESTETELSKSEDAASKRLEKAKERKANTERMKVEAKALEDLGGGSEAGQHLVKKVETPKEYVKREFSWLK